MPRRQVFQNTFEAGEIAPEFLLRADTEQASAACKKLRNAVVTASGSAKRRPGTVRDLDLTSADRVEVIDIDASVRRFIAFSDGEARVYDESFSLEYTLLTAPWGAGDVQKMAITAFDGSVYIFSTAFAPYRMTFVAGAWASAPLSFASGPGNRSRQPYFKYNDTIGISITPSALAGSITLFASAPFFTSDYINQRIRLLGQEVRITAVSSSTIATGLVLQQLYGVKTLTVDDSGGFEIGDTVQGDQSGVRAEVLAVPAGTSLTVQMLNSLGNFDTPEALIGPNATTNVTAQASGSPAAVLEWDEPLISAARGYPATGAFHRARLVIAGIPAYPSIIAASATNSPNDFAIGTGPNDAFIEPLGDGAVTAVRHLVSWEQLIILTDKGAYYVPEGQLGFRPDTIAYFNIGPEGASEAQPALATEGVLFIDSTTGRLLTVRPTGLQARPYEIQELSQSAYHLLNNVRRVAVALAVDGRPERFLLCLNGDGTMAVMNYTRGGNVLGFGLWAMAAGSFVDIAVTNDRAYVVTSRGGQSRLCHFDDAALLDEQDSYTAALVGRDGETLSVDWGRTYAGSGLVASGVVGQVAAGADRFAGYDFTVEIQPFPPVDARTGAQPKRIINGEVSVYATGGFRINGEFQSAYKGGQDLTQPPALRTEDVEFFMLDTEDLTDAPIISQDRAAPLMVRGITLRGRM